MRVSSSKEKVYFVDHFARITTWDDPRLSLSPFPPAIDRFLRKRTYFRKQPSMHVQPGPCLIKVGRNHVFEDAFTEIMRQSPEELKGRLLVSFQGEEHLGAASKSPDYSREFFFLLSREISNPSRSLFEYSSDNKKRLRINPSSGSSNPEHLTHFKFIGRCIGLCIFHSYFLHIPFITTFYKMILQKFELSDMESTDAELYRLSWILENDITGIRRTFSVAEVRLGEIKTFELKPGGYNIKVNEENKKEYVQLLIQHYVCKRVQDQFDAFMSGFSELVPFDLIKAFDEYELKHLISGTSKIDVDDWMKHTVYEGYDSNDDVIQWFWQCVRSWPSERQSHLLRFATGSPRVPVKGFQELKRPFTIAKAGHLSEHPESNAGFNCIVLPPYKDYANLEQELVLVVDRP